MQYLLSLLLFISALLQQVNAQQSKKQLSHNNVPPLPACIRALQAKDSLAIAIEYRYKGQRWFVLDKKQPGSASRNSDNMTITRFFDDSCRLVGTWKKGGIAGLNKMVPDTIEKNTLFPFVPDTILKKAIQEKIPVIQLCRYNNELVYLLSKHTTAQNRSTSYFTESYYAADGKLVKINHYTQPWNYPRKEAALIPELDRLRL